MTREDAIGYESAKSAKTRESALYAGHLRVGGSHRFGDVYKQCDEVFAIRF